MAQGRQFQQIVQQELALDDYLSTLLAEIPQDEAQAESITAETEPEEALIKPATPVSEPIIESQSIKTEVNKRPLQRVENPVEQRHQALSVMPAWSQQEFQALFFKVDHLILAAPLTDLLRTINVERKPTKIPGQPSWFMGLLDDHQNRIGVLDTGQMVLGKKRGGQRDMAQKPFKSILITQDGRWGLACDEILSISRLTPEKVRWRTRREKRPWLVGTVIEELIAVIDIQQLTPHRKQ